MTRELGPGERMYWIANQWAPNSAMAMCELEGLLDDARLAVAYAALTRQHPLLSLRVVADARGRHPRFVPRESPAPFESISIAPAQLDRLLSDQLNRPLDASSSLVQLCHVRAGQRSVVVLVCLHIVTDGLSIMTALRDLLAHYDRAADSCEPEPWPLRPPCEELLRAHRTGAWTVAKVQWRALQEQRRARAQRLPAEQLTPLAERRSVLERRQLSPSRAEALLAACRARGVTLHGLLSAALALAVADELELRTAAEPKLSLGSTVSFRDRLEPALGAELGCYVSILNTFVDVRADRDLWQIARAINEELQQRRTRAEHLSVIKLLEWLAPASFARSGSLIRTVEAQGPGNLAISNLGRFDFPTRVGTVRVLAAHCTAGLSITGYFLCAITSTACGMQLNFSYTTGCVSQARATRIIDGMLRWLAGQALQGDRRHEATTWSRTVSLHRPNSGS